MHSKVKGTVKQGNLKHLCRESLMESIVFLHLRALEEIGLLERLLMYSS